MSKTTLKMFVGKLLTNETLCPQSRDYTIRSEDWNIAICLSRMNIYPVDSRDWLKRQRFLMLDPERHLLKYAFEWYYQRQYYLDDEGLDCCSKYTVSFHYIFIRKSFTKCFI